MATMLVNPYSDIGTQDRTDLLELETSDTVKSHVDVPPATKLLTPIAPEIPTSGGHYD